MDAPARPTVSAAPLVSTAPRVSAALIVRNEERTLGRCLRSLAGHVDEIVVVDTGSTDATPAIAAAAGARVLDFAWVDDFSAARQFAFDRCTGDWVLWVDADDVVLGGENIRDLAASAPAGVEGFSWRYVSARDDLGHARCSFWRERMVRNNGAFRWSGRVHEVLVATRPARLEKSGQVMVDHRPPPGLGERKNRRNLALIQAEASSGEPSARSLFYLASETAGAGDPQTALELYARCAELSTWVEERCLAHTRRAELLRVLGHFEAAIQADQQALDLQPEWPEALFGLAETYYYLKDWPQVALWAERGRQAQPPERIHFTDPMRLQYDWIIHYTVALIHLGRQEEAMRWTRRALQICPTDPWHRENFRLLTAANASRGRMANVEVQE